MPIVPDAQPPAGGISSPATDLATWVQSRLGGGTLGDLMIVAAAVLDATLTPHKQSHPLADVDQPAGFHGLGWEINIDHPASSDVPLGRLQP